MAIVVIVGLVSVGCTQARQASMANGGWMVVLATQPQRPVALRRVTLLLTVKDPANAPMTVDELTAVARMPEMEHEETRIVFRPVSPGRYEATVTFSMDGVWEMGLEGHHLGQRYALRIPVRIGK